MWSWTCPTFWSLNGANQTKRLGAAVRWEWCLNEYHLDWFHESPNGRCSLSLGFWYCTKAGLQFFCIVYASVQVELWEVLTKMAWLYLRTIFAFPCLRKVHMHNYCAIIALLDRPGCRKTFKGGHYIFSGGQTFSSYNLFASRWTIWLCDHSYSAEK